MNKDPQQAVDHASEQARFAAREFVARFARETGCDLGELVTDRMLFAFEIGYLRGRSDAAESMVEMMKESR